MSNSHKKSNQKIGPDCLCLIKADKHPRNHIDKLVGRVIKTSKAVFNQIDEKSWTYSEPANPFIIEGEIIECIPEVLLVKISDPDIDTTETTYTRLPADITFI